MLCCFYLIGTQPQQNVGCLRFCGLPHFHSSTRQKQREAKHKDKKLMTAHIFKEFRHTLLQLTIL